MRDRTLAMKWVEAVAIECGGDASLVLSKLTAHGVSQNTIDDQMRRLKKHGLVIATDKEAAIGNDNPVRSKPFKPAPKSGVIKKRK